MGMMMFYLFHSVKAGNTRQIAGEKEDTPFWRLI